MPSTIVGVLLERHRDHIVLANGTQIFLDEGVTINPLPIGATLTILCTPQGDKKLAHYIRVNPDGVLVPRRSAEGRLPRRDGGGGVDCASEQAIAARVCVSRSTRGTPRQALCCPGGGPALGGPCNPPVLRSEKWWTILDLNQ